jgi:hypothetical protein
MPENNFSETRLFPSSGEGKETPTLLVYCKESGHSGSRQRTRKCSLLLTSKKNKKKLPSLRPRSTFSSQNGNGILRKDNPIEEQAFLLSN